MTSLAVITPSRGRPQNIKDLIESFGNTKATCDLWVVCDEDDPTLDQYKALNLDHLLIYERTQKGMARPLNLAARDIFALGKYKYFGFLGDDHRPRSLYWDIDWTIVLDQGVGLVYGNDLLQGENLPTAVAMHGTIVQELDGMVPDHLLHLYLDNFWKTLGLDIGALTYLPETIIEHMHPLAGKAEVDQGYVDVNAPEVYDADKIVFDKYIKSDAYRDLVRRLM